MGMRERAALVRAELERRVEERTRELKQAQAQLVDTARAAAACLRSNSPCVPAEVCANAASFPAHAAAGRTTSEFSVRLLGRMWRRMIIGVRVSSRAKKPGAKTRIITKAGSPSP